MSKHNVSNLASFSAQENEKAIEKEIKEFKPRWKATATFKTEAGIHFETKEFEELFETQDWMEHGPSWEALLSLVIVYQSIAEPITIEETLRK